MDLATDSLVELPETFGKLEALTELDVSSNKLVFAVEYGRLFVQSPLDPIGSPQASQGSSMGARHGSGLVQGWESVC